MARVALVNRQVVVHLWGRPLRHMIAMPDSQIGWPGGQFQRRNGAATMLAKVALQLQEGVLELDLLADLTRLERWH